MDTHWFQFPGGSVVITTMTGGKPDDPDFCFSFKGVKPPYESHLGIFAAEILKLANRVEELEAYVSKCEALVVRYGDELTSLRAEREELAQRNVELEERVRELEDESEARIWGRIESLRADLETAKGLRDVAVGERDELAARVTELETENLRLEGELHASKAYAAVMAEEDKKLCLEVDRLRYAEGRLTSLRLEVDKRGERIAHLESLLQGHETNANLAKARIDALTAEAQELEMLVEGLRSELANSFNENLALRAGAPEALRQESNNLRIENERLRIDLAAAIKTIEHLNRELVKRWFREQLTSAEQPQK